MLFIQPVFVSNCLACNAFKAPLRVHRCGSTVHPPSAQKDLCLREWHPGHNLINKYVVNNANNGNPGILKHVAISYCTATTRAPLPTAPSTFPMIIRYLSGVSRTWQFSNAKTRKSQEQEIESPQETSPAPRKFHKVCWFSLAEAFRSQTIWHFLLFCTFFSICHLPPRDGMDIWTSVVPRQLRSSAGLLNDTPCGQRRTKSISTPQWCIFWHLDRIATK